jgi:hypothetical protein
MAFVSYWYIAKKQKTNDAVKGHVGEFACAVVVDNTRDFVCKCAEAEHISDGLVIVIVNDVVLLGGMGNVVVSVGIVGFDKAEHGGVWDGSQDLDAGLFLSGRMNSLPRMLHVAL